MLPLQQFFFYRGFYSFHCFNICFRQVMSPSSCKFLRQRIDQRSHQLVLPRGKRTLAHAPSIAGFIRSSKVRGNTFINAANIIFFGNSMFYQNPWRRLTLTLLLISSAYCISRINRRMHTCEHGIAPHNASISHVSRNTHSTSIYCNLNWPSFIASSTILISWPPNRVRRFGYRNICSTECYK